MTDTQSNQLIQHSNTKKALAVLQKFAAIEAQFKEAEAKAKEATEQIKQAMIDNGVTKIDGDWGYITLAERVTYKAEDIDQVSDEFIKKALDSSKVKAATTLTGELPAGISESRTQYITKKFKEL